MDTFHSPLHLVAAPLQGAEVGTITHWDSSTVQLDALAEAWEQAQLTGPHGALQRPLPPSPAKALELACRSVADGRHTIVRRHPRGGVLLISEHDSGTEGQDPEYTPDLWVRLEKGALTWNRGDHPLMHAIRTKYHELRGALTAQAAGNWLAAIARQLDGVPLRRAGGMYFVPAGPSDTWARVVELLSEHSQGAIVVYRIPAFAAAGDTLPAVLRAVQDELASVVDRLGREILSEQMGDRAKETKRGEVAGLLSTIARYERLTGVALDELRKGANKLGDSLAQHQLSDEDALGGL